MTVFSEVYWVRSALFWDVTQCMVVIHYGSFGTDTFSRNVDN